MSDIRLLIDALKSSGYTEGITYLDKQPTKKKRNRQRNVIWFNPPFSNNVTTNIGATFLKLINKHFPKKSKLNNIFNRNTVKISYSCMPNIASIIKAHNKQISTSGTGTDPITCNCRKKDLCIFRTRLYVDQASVMDWGRDVALRKERSLLVRWVVGSILHGGPIELCLVPTSAPRLV